MNNKNYLVGGVIAVVVISAGYFFWQGYSKPSTEMQTTNTATTEISPTQTSQATTSGKVTAKTTVNYSDSGFTPNNITVKVGETVTWSNQSSATMWVASNPHPTHTDLLGFDELASADRGGTYSYTFTKVGNWGYHNHLSPSDKGVVTVQ